MQLPWLLQFSDLALLFMRLLVGLVFISSGSSHFKDPVTRGKSLGLSPGFTRFLGLAEITGGLGVALGVLTQVAALGLILIMLGAIHRKIFVWKTGFWGKHGDGWSYDLLFVAMSLVIATTGGGRFKLATLLGAPLLAQAPTDSVTTVPQKLCFVGRPAQFCRMFTVTEFGYARMVGGDQSEGFFDHHVEPHVVMWELGLMRNTDAQSALGGTVLLTSRFSVGLKARYRRWLWRDVSLEVAPGLILYDDRDAARTPAFTGHMLVNLGDVLSVGAMLEASRFGTNSFDTPAATITKPYLVARLGSYPGLIGATASGVLLGVLALLFPGPTYF